MKKLLLMMLMVATAITSCSKEDENTSPPIPEEKISMSYTISTVLDLIEFADIKVTYRDGDGNDKSITLTDKKDFPWTISFDELTSPQTAKLKIEFVPNGVDSAGKDSYEFNTNYRITCGGQLEKLNTTDTIESDKIAEAITYYKENPIEISLNSKI